MRGKAPVLLLLVFFTTWLVSCGSDPSGPEVEEVVTKIPPTTKLVPDSALVEHAGDTFTIEKQAIPREIALNDVIVSESGRGILRRVLSVQDAGDRVVVETGPAVLTDAIEAGEIRVTRHLTVDDVDGGRLAAPWRGALVESSQGGIFWQFRDAVVWDYDGDRNTTLDQVRFDGTISVDPTFDVYMRIDRFALVQLRIVFSVDEAIELDFEGGIDFDFLEGLDDVELVRVPFNPIVVWVGFVPVVFTPEIAIKLGADGHAFGGVSVGMDQALSATAGIQYNNGAWSPVREHTESAQFDGPRLSAGCRVKGYVGPELEVLVYGLVGPYASIRGFLELEADVFADPWWELYAGIEAGAGAEFEILGHEIADYEMPGVIGYRKLLGQAAGAPMGEIAGIVRDAFTRTALAGATVEVKMGASVVASVETGAGGEYVLQVPCATGYAIAVSKSGYLSETCYGVDVAADATKYLEAILQIDEQHAGLGDAGGCVVNAVNGLGVGGLAIALRHGINVAAGTVVATATTDATGSYLFSSLDAGNYTGEITGAGYNTAHFTLTCIGNQSIQNQDAVVTPLLPAGETRIILTWGATPTDLDSHLTGPLPDGTRFHMYYVYNESGGRGSPWPDVVKLDLDDVNSYGPETTTLFQQITGTYRFTVHDFTNRTLSSSRGLANSGAVVRVYTGGDLAAAFAVPNDQDGTLWTVFEMRDGRITPVNSMSYTFDPGGIQLAPKWAADASQR